MNRYLPFELSEHFKIKSENEQFGTILPDDFHSMSTSMYFGVSWILNG